MIVDRYAVSPMQLGMLFHCGADPGRGVYISQIVFTLAETVDTSALARAWQAAIDRHAALRSSFSLDGDDGALQVVWDTVPCPIDVAPPIPSAADADAWLASYLEADRRRGFDLTQPPLMRLSLVRDHAGTQHLVWTYHHALIDGRSRAVVLRDVTALYESYRSGTDREWSPPSQYRDYLTWLTTDGRCDGASYWPSLLKAPPSPWSPADLRGDVGSPRGAAFKTVTIDRVPDGASLRRVTAASNATVGLLLQLVWALLISRHSGRDDVVFGATRACRRGRPKGFMDVVGVRMNTVPVRLHLEPHESVLDCLGRLRTQHRAAREFETAPLTSIREWCGRSGRDSLFETLVVFEESIIDLPERPSAQQWQTQVQRFGYTHYPLVLFGHERPSLALEIHYDARQVSDATAQGAARHLACALDRIVTDPTCRIDQVDVLPREERRQIVETWNATTRTHPDDGWIQQWFEQQVVKSPEAVALVFGTEQVSYRALNRRANQLARELVARGAVGGRVAICLDRSIDMVVAAMAVLKAGAAYVSLDRAHPEARLQVILDDLDASVLVATSHWPQHLSRVVPTVCVDRDGDRIARHADDDLNLPTTAEDVVYITYTSGSTGTPKGIPLPQRSLANLLQWYWTAVGSAATTLQYASLGFDMAAYEIFSTLCSGGRLVLMPERARQDVGALSEILERHRVQIAMLPGVVLDQLAQECNRTERHLPALRDLIAAGEQLQITDAMRALFAKGHRILHNHYGPSETHVVTAYTLTGPPRTWPSRPPIGRPIANTQIYVVDRRGAPTPIGVAGELQIGGVSLAHGYWRRPELTATQFVADRFSAQPGARLYRTGDLARWLPDGTLEFLGRRDHQVKVRGHRVELGEIEAVLTQHVAVHQAVVVARTATNDDVRLTAYVVPHGEAPALAETLRAHLQSLLPDYMWPTQVVLLTTLPVTAHGKVDRQALPIPDEREPSHAYEPPRTETEVRLAGIWADVLGVARVGIHDNFFDLGGHSLLAMRVVNRVRQVFQRPVEVAALFRSPTVSEFGILLDRLDLSPVSPSMTLTPVLSKVGLPLTINQEKRLMFDECLRLGRQSPQPFNVAMCLRFDGLLDIDALEGALQRIVSRHDILRARFTPVATTMVPQYERYQRLTDFWKTGRFAPGLFTYSIAPVEAIAVRLEHVRTLGDGPLDVALDTVVRGAVQAYIATNDPPLIRALLIETDPQIHLLILTMPHLISDGRTLEVIKGELRDTYHRLASGTPVAMSVPPYQMADFAVFQHAYLKGEAVHAAVEYWSTHWSEYGHARLRLSDFPRLRETAGGVEQEKPSRRLRLSKSVTDDIRRCARHANTTLYMFFLATFYLALYRHTRKPRVALWANCENRTRPEFSNVVGWFVNSHLLGISFESDPTCAELLSQVQRLVLEATKHQDLPTTALWTMLGTSPDVDELQVFFEFKRQSERCGSERSGMDIQEVRLPLMSSTVFARHFFVMVTEDGPEIELAFGFSSSSVDEEGMRQWLDDWAALSRSMPAMLETRLSQFL